MDHRASVLHLVLSLTSLLFHCARLGGELASGYTNDVWRLASPTSQWHEQNPMAIAARAWFSYGAFESQIIVGFGVGSDTAAAANTLLSRQTARTMRALCEAPAHTALLSDWSSFDGETWAAPIDAGVTRGRSTGHMPTINGTMMIIGQKQNKNREGSGEEGHVVQCARSQRSC